MKKIHPVRLSFLCLTCFAALFLYAAESAPLNSTAKLHARSKANVVIEKLNKSVSLSPDQCLKIQEKADALCADAQKKDSLSLERQLDIINQNAKHIMRYAVDSVFSEEQKREFAVKVQEYHQAEVNKVINSNTKR